MPLPDSSWEALAARPWLPFVVGVSGLALSAGIAWVLDARDDRILAERFSRHAQRHTGKIEEELEDQRHAGAALAAFFQSSVKVEPEEFETYTTSLFRDRPEIIAALWVPDTDSASLTVTLAAPVAAAPLRGLSLAGTPNMADALRRSDRLGQAQFATWPSSVAPPNSKSAIGAVVCPVAPSPSGQWEAGQAIVLFSYQAMLDSTVLHRPESTLSYSLFDSGPITAGAPLASTGTELELPPTVNPTLRPLHGTLALPGGQWAIRIAPTTVFVTERRRSLATPALVTGALLSGLLVALLLFADRSSRLRSSARWSHELSAVVATLREEVATRQHLMRALEESEGFFRALSEGAPVGMFRTDATGRVIYSNDTYHAILGRPAESCKGMQYSEGIAVEERERGAHLFEEAIRAQTPVELTATLERPDGTQRSAAMLARPMFTEAGEFIGYAGSVLDLTERQALEREREVMRAQLLQAQRLEAMGRMAAGIAHEINTPIQYIANNTLFLHDAARELMGLIGRQRDLLATPDPTAAGGPVGLLEALTEVTASADVEHLMARMPAALADSQEGIDRVTRVVGAMREFTHPGTGRAAPVDLNRALASTVAISRSEWKQTATLGLELDETLPPLLAFGCELNQAFLNLLLNAVQAVAERQEHEPELVGAIRVCTVREAAHARIEFHDNGCGIAPEVRHKIFDPYFTTKAIGKGTGQGLALVHSTVCLQHHGSIDVESTVGSGTTFTLRLPFMPARENPHA